MVQATPVTVVVEVLVVEVLTVAQVVAADQATEVGLVVHQDQTQRPVDLRTTVQVSRQVAQAMHFMPVERQ